MSAFDRACVKSPNRDHFGGASFFPEGRSSCRKRFRKLSYELASLLPCFYTNSVESGHLLIQQAKEGMTRSMRSGPALSV
jgi:hypothetical protein